MLPSRISCFMHVCYQYVYSLTLNITVKSQITVLRSGTVVPVAIISNEDIKPRPMFFCCVIMSLLLAMIIIGFQVSIGSKIMCCASQLRKQYSLLLELKMKI